MNILDFLEPIVGALVGGGIVTIFCLPEKKMSAKIDNAEKLVKEYTSLMEKYKNELKDRDQRIDELQARISELEKKSRTDRDTRDKRIAELESQVRDLEDKLHSMERQRNKRGQYVKKDAQK